MLHMFTCFFLFLPFVLCLNFFPLFTQSHKHTICSMHSVCLSFFLSLFFHRFNSFWSCLLYWYVLQKKSFVLNNTSFFCSLVHSPNDYLLMLRFTEKKRTHKLNMQVRKVRAKTPIFTRHTATKRECNWAMQCNTHNNCEKKTTAHRSIARITIYKYILCSAFNLIVAIAVVVALL